MDRCVGLLVCGLFLAGCEIVGNTDEIDYDAIEEIHYAQHVQPLLTERCASCHAGPDAAAGLRLEGWDDLVAGSDHGAVVVPFDPEESLLLALLEKPGGPHPADVGADTLSQAERRFLARWIDEGARNDAGAVPHEDAALLLYVCNQNDARISVIDMETNLLVRNVDLQALGFSANARPHDIAMTADRQHWYVSLIGENRVLKFDRHNVLVGQAALEVPGLLALLPSEERLYVGRSLSAANPPASLGVVRTADMQVEDEVGVVFPRPHALAHTPSGAYVLTASLGENRLMAVDTGTGDVSFTTVAGAAPHTLVQHTVSPDGRTMFSAAQTTSQLLVFDIQDPEHITQIGAIPMGDGPFHPMFTPDGSQVWVGNVGANVVTVVDARTHAVVRVIEGEGLSEPHAVVFSPDGRRAYVSNRNTTGHYRPRHDLGDNATDGTVVVIDTETYEIVQVIEIGRYPSGLSSGPHGGHHHGSATHDAAR